MKFFLDTAAVSDIRWAARAGLIDGVTTNPTLMAKHAGDADPRDVLREICATVEGHVSAEVVAVEAEGMYEEGRELARIADNIVVKIPLIEDGLVATRRLVADGIKVNVTLAFSSVQCLLAAKAGATYVSPFLGRIDDIGHDAMDVIRETRLIFDNYSYETEILAASIRHPRHVAEAAMLGADVATVPTDVLRKMLLHPLTDRGLDQFLNDWSKLVARGKGGV
ncbi:MAG: fructose-6-phosphate aldolase [Gemmatimonas sp. SG8_28]|jgi:transaldolase|nr:MAG: fructose-6-phosphate aldolase [Gemmatimonas sp. SG8_28]